MSGTLDEVCEVYDEDEEIDENDEGVRNILDTMIEALEFVNKTVTDTVLGYKKAITENTYELEYIKDEKIKKLFLSFIPEILENIEKELDDLESMKYEKR